MLWVRRAPVGLSCESLADDSWWGRATTFALCVVMAVSP